MNIRSREPGQIVVLFALFLIAMVGMAGLVLDGGSTYAQRRAEQNAADLAAMAGANLQLNGGSDAAVKTLAQKVAKDNRFEHGTDLTRVTVTPSAGSVKVDITTPHANYFAGVFGMHEWPVSVTATASWGVPVGTTGIAPILFSVLAFGPNGLPYDEYGCSGSCTDSESFEFTKTQGKNKDCVSAIQCLEWGSDAPIDATNMAWTTLQPDPNVNSALVESIIAGDVVMSAAPAINQYVGQHNQGVQNDLFDTNAPRRHSINTDLAGQDVIVPIVGAPVAPNTTCTATSYTNGCFRGWALFHVTSADKNGGGQDGTVTGYFKTGIARVGSDVPLCKAGPSCPGFHGLYVLRVTN